MKKRTAAEIESAFDKHLPEVKQDIAEAKDLLKTVEDDFSESRDCLKRLIKGAEKAIDLLVIMTEDTEHPKSFEVLAMLLKTAADLNAQVMDLSGTRQKLHKAAGSGSGETSGDGTTITQNNVFMGTSGELQKMIEAGMQAAKVVDV